MHLLFTALLDISKLACMGTLDLVFILYERILYPQTCLAGFRSSFPLKYVFLSGFLLLSGQCNIHGERKTGTAVSPGWIRTRRFYVEINVTIESLVRMVCRVVPSIGCCTPWTICLSAFIPLFDIAIRSQSCPESFVGFYPSSMG